MNGCWTVSATFKLDSVWNNNGLTENKPMLGSKEGILLVLLITEVPSIFDVHSLTDHLTVASFL